MVVLSLQLKDACALSPQRTDASGLPLNSRRRLRLAVKLSSPTHSSFYLWDGIPSIRQLTDDLEVVTDEYSFAAFGTLRSSTGSTANSQQYKGRLIAYRRDPAKVHARDDRFLLESLASHQERWYFIVQIKHRN